MMKIKIYDDYIIHLNYDTQYELCSTFMRLQEYYESPYPEIKGVFFSLEKFMDVYAKNIGNFTYTTDWQGFNVPDSVIREFYRKFRNGMLNKEKVLFKLIRPYTSRIHKFYLIGTFKNDKQALKHEMAHALWYLNDNYQEEMKMNIRKCNSAQILSFTDYLYGRGYCNEMIDDEIQAYFSTDKMDAKYNTSRFKGTFNKYMKGIKL